MKFNKDILWIEQGHKLLLMGLEDNLVLALTGPLKDEILDNLKLGLQINCSLLSDEFEVLKNLFQAANLLDVTNKLDQQLLNLETVNFKNGSQISLIDLAKKCEEDFQEYAVFAKYPDPTSVVGRGGYDDDVGPAPTLPAIS